MKKMIFFLAIGGTAVFCRFGLKHSGFLLDVGVFLGLLGFFMMTEKVRPFIERLKERKAKEKKEKGKAEEKKKGQIEMSAGI